jgi:hypothetical protein
VLFRSDVQALADGAAQQVQRVGGRQLPAGDVLDQRHVLNEVEDGHAIREFTTQGGLDPFAGRHGVAW